MCSFFLKTVPEEWSHPVEELFERLDPAKAPGNVTLLLELFKILPEEIQRADLPTSQRSKITSELTCSLPKILHFLDLTLGANDTTVVQMGLHCLQSWVHFEIPLLSFAPVITKAVHLLSGEDTFPIVVDVLQEVIATSQSIHFENTICEELLKHISSNWFRQKFQVNYDGKTSFQFEPLFLLF